MRLLDPLDIHFEGFTSEAFDILARLESEPHIGRYREEKEGIQRLLFAPFKRYRDDLVVNWVLPSQLDLETERNVFSRLLKNDFGAGGCHHHLWLSFYRRGLTRLTDIQLAHSIHPDRFSVSLYASKRAGAAFQRACRAMAGDRSGFLERLQFLSRWETAEIGLELRNPVRAYQTRLSRFDGRRLDPLPSMSGIWFAVSFPRQVVTRGRGGLVDSTLRVVQDLWPIYSFWLRGADEAEGGWERGVPDPLLDSPGR